MLVGVVGLLNVSMYVFVSTVLVSLCMEILLTSVMPCGLRCNLISWREHDARSGDFITPFEKFRVGWGYVFMFSFPNCFHFSIFSDYFWFVVCIIMVLFIAFLYWLVYSVFLLFFELGLGIVWCMGFFYWFKYYELIEVFICFAFTFWFFEGSFNFFGFCLGYIFIGYKEFHWLCSPPTTESHIGMCLGGNPFAL